MPSVRTPWRALPSGPHGAAPPPRTDCRRQRCVALTFDDGPAPGTDRLLRVLADRGVRVTFFVLGSQVERHPGVVGRAAAAGHEIGSHALSHADLTRLPTGRIRTELSRTGTAIKRAGGVTPRVFRPPYGATDARVVAAAGRQGLALVLWSGDTLDWRDRDSRTVERRAVAAARGGQIILMHDIHPTTVAAVPKIIDRLAARGFVFVTVSEMLRSDLSRPGKVHTEGPEPAAQSDTRH